MASIGIVTDSTSGLSEVQLKEHGIASVPLYVRFGTEMFKEGVDLSSEEFYRRLTEREVFPATSQPSPGDFLEVYRKLEREVDSIVSIHISSRLSGTCESAIAASKDPDLKVKVDVVDSLSVSLGAGYMAISAAKMAAAGEDRESILRALAEMVAATRIAFIVDTLEYLRRGGRIGGAQAFLGSLLRIKPVLHIVNGQVEPLDRSRSTRRGMERVIRYVEDEWGKDPLPFAAVLHAVAPDEAERMKEVISARFEVGEWYKGELSPVIGTHCGPGLVGLCFHGRRR